MGYSVNYCITQIRGINHNLKFLKEDLTKLNSLKQGLGEADCMTYGVTSSLNSALESINYARGSQAARNFSAKCEDIQAQYNTWKSSLSSIMSSITSAIGTVTTRISESERELRIWERYLDLAKREENE